MRSGSRRGANPSVRVPARSSASATRRSRAAGASHQPARQPMGSSVRPNAPQAGFASPPSSRTIGQIRSSAKREQRASAAQRLTVSSRVPLVILGVAAAVILAAVIALAVLSNTEAFRIQHLQIEGTDHLTDEEVSALVTIPEGTTLLSVDADGIEASLIRDSWIEDVVVNRVFPDTLKIDVTERKMAAVAEVPIGAAQTIQKWALAEDGMWLMAIPERSSELGSKISEQIYADADQVLHIKGIEYGVDPKIGSYCTDDPILNALSIISGLTTDLASRVKSVTATDAESTLLTLDNNVEIAFGTADNIREKERICNQIMEEKPKVVYINVRTPDRPTWRSA